MKEKTVRERIRAKGGLNKIAREIGVYPQKLYYWVTKRKYPVMYIRKLAKALDLKAETLLIMIEKEEAEKVNNEQE